MIKPSGFPPRALAEEMSVSDCSPFGVWQLLLWHWSTLPGWFHLYHAHPLKRGCFPCAEMAILRLLLTPAFAFGSLSQSQASLYIRAAGRNKSTAIVGGFQFPLWAIEQGDKKISKTTEASNNITPVKNSWIHILFKCTRNTCQDRSHTGS